MTTSEQARADAIADAETLRLVAQEIRFSERWTRSRRGRAASGPGRVRIAELKAEWAVSMLRTAHIERQPVKTIVRDAYEAARAAFRAVPGLREE